jgi:hypothetical protein
MSYEEEVYINYLVFWGLGCMGMVGRGMESKVMIEIQENLKAAFRVKVRGITTQDKTSLQYAPIHAVYFLASPVYHA